MPKEQIVLHPSSKRPTRVNTNLMEKYKLAISTISMGWHPTHTLERKIAAAASYGFFGIEMFHSDLLKYAEAYSISSLEAAGAIRKLCKHHNLSVICLGSFDNFEGSKISLRERLETASEWIQLALELDTSIIQIPSNFENDSNGEEKVIVSDLQALADLGNPHGISFAYEALAWGTHVADWEESLRIVQLVDRSNFGLCLDQYHVLSRLWADPRSHSGKRPGGDAALRASTRRFLEDCPTEKIFYLQLSDAERLEVPILPGHRAYNIEKDGTHSWCSYGRLFPLEKEKGAYLPMFEISKAWLVEKSWSGWVSLEIFHREMEEEAAGPEYWAQRGVRSWEKLKALMKR